MPEMDTAAITNVFETVKRLLEKDPSRNVPREVAYTEAGGIELSVASGMLQSQESLSLTVAQVGDVVWWRDQAGTMGYYLVTEPYTSGRSEEDIYSTPGKGVIKFTTEKGEIISKDTVISGASFGGTVLQYKIAKNIPLEFVAGPDQQDPNDTFPWSRFFYTPEIVDMGIIKVADLQDKG